MKGGITMKRVVISLIGITMIVFLLVGSAKAEEGSHISENMAQIKGVFVDEATGRPLQITPSLWFTYPKGITAAEKADLSAKFKAQKVKKETDSSGTLSIVIVDVVPGKYALFTRRHGIITPDFKVSPGEIVNLGIIKVKTK